MLPRPWSVMRPEIRPMLPGKTATFSRRSWRAGAPWCSGTRPTHRGQESSCIRSEADDRPALRWISFPGARKHPLALDAAGVRALAANCRRLPSSRTCVIAEVTGADRAQPTRLELVEFERRMYKALYYADTVGAHGHAGRPAGSAAFVIDRPTTSSYHLQTDPFEVYRSTPFPTGGERRPLRGMPHHRSSVEATAPWIPAGVAARSSTTSTPPRTPWRPLAQITGRTVHLLAPVRRRARLLFLCEPPHPQPRRSRHRASLRKSRMKPSCGWPTSGASSTIY